MYDECTIAEFFSCDYCCADVVVGVSRNNDERHNHANKRKGVLINHTKTPASIKRNLESQ